MTDPYSALVQREGAIPGLLLLFDPPRLARILEQRSGATIAGLRPTYLRYKRDTNCLVAYEVSGSMGTSVVHVKAFRTGGLGKLTKPSELAAASTWLGAGPVVLHDLGISVWPWPYDAKLTQLRYVADEEGRAILLKRAPAGLDGAQHALRPLSYKPERRFVAALASDDDNNRAVLRMYNAGGYAPALARSTCVSSRETLKVPSRRSRDRWRRVLFFDWLEGRSAAEFVKSAEPLRDRPELIGRALAEWHRQRLASTTPSSPSFDIARTCAGIADLTMLFPALERRLDQLADGLTRLSDAFRVPLAPVHGDFHLGQVLLAPASVSVIDFDRSGAGPGVGDLAFCRANLERDVESGGLTRQRADDLFEGLLAGYGRVRQRPSSAVLDAYTAAAIGALLPEPFRLFRPGAVELTERLLDRALALVERTTVRRAVS